MNQELSEFAKRFHKLVSSIAANDPLWDGFGITVQKRLDLRGQGGKVVEAVIGPAHVMASKDNGVVTLGIVVETRRGPVDITDEPWMCEKLIVHIRIAMAVIEEARRVAAINALAAVDEAIRVAGKPMVTEESEAHQ